ncbi:MAG TPA: hypothetical protein VGC57_09445 [Cellulomonas sp.]
MKTIARAWTSVACTAVLFAVGMPTATADPGSPEEIAELVSRVAPDQAVVLTGTVQQDTVSAELVDGAVEIPLTGDAPLTLSCGGTTIPVGLPLEAGLGSGEMAPDGTVVVDGSSAGADVAVQARADGAVRVQTITQGSDGAHRFTYTLPDEWSIATIPGEGLVATSSTSTDGTSLEIADPWAVDANGTAVTTWYEVDGSTFTQVIAPDGGTVYPIVADPTYSVGRGYYAHFDRAETKTVAGGGWAATGASGICAVVGGLMGGPIGTAVLSASCLGLAGTIVYQAGVAQSSSPKKCLFVKYTVATLLPLPVPKFSAGTYSDRRCR